MLTRIARLLGIARGALLAVPAFDALVRSSAQKDTFRAGSIMRCYQCGARLDVEWPIRDLAVVAELGEWITRHTPKHDPPRPVPVRGFVRGIDPRKMN